MKGEENRGSGIATAEIADAKKGGRMCEQDQIAANRLGISTHDHDIVVRVQTWIQILVSKVSTSIMKFTMLRNGPQCVVLNASLWQVRK